MRSLVCYIIALTFVLPSFVQAQLSTVVQGAEVIAKDAMEPALAKELADIGAKTLTQEFSQQGELVYKFLDADGKIIRQFVAPKASPEMLEAAKPSNLFASLKGLSAKVKSGLVTAGKVTAATSLSQIKKFPIEAFTFFVALGAVSTLDLVHNYNSNPAAYDELIEGQKDPITQIGFAAFMLANGASTQPLAAIFKSPALHASLPYLGMSIGMAASSIVGEVGHIPGLKECAISFKFNKEACDEAYTNWQKFSFADKGMKMMPSLTAMLATTLLMGAAQSVGYKLVMFAAKQSMAVAAKVLAFNILISCNEAGWVVKGVQIAFWGWQVLQLAGFIDTSNYLEIPLTHLWNNTVMIGPKLSKNRNVLVSASTTGNMNGVAQSLTAFSDLMDKWRENNSLDVLTAHSHWINFLSQMSAEYNVSKIFYSNLLNDLWLTKNHPNMPDHANISRLFPLYGVSGNEFQKIPAVKYFSLVAMQDGVEDDQKLTLGKVASVIESFEQNRADQLHKMKPEEQQMVSEIHADFASQDIQKMTEALNKLNQALGISGTPTPTFFGWGGHSDEFLAFAKGLRDIIGDPRPMLAPGAGYLHALDEYYKEQGLIDVFPETIEQVSVPTAPEAILYRMFTGPNADHDKLIDTTWTGFKSHFLPPKIVSNEMVDYTMPPTRQTSVGYVRPDIFRMSYDLDPRWFQSGPNYQYNLFLGLVNKASIPSDIIGDSNGPKVDAWWSQKVEPQYISAWIDFENKYQGIVQLLYKDLWKTKTDMSNFTDVSNGIVDATREELDVYANLLMALSPQSKVNTAGKKSLDAAERNLENLLRGIRLNTQQSVNMSTGKASLISRISNSDLDAAQQAYSDQLKNLTDMIVAQPMNATPARQEVLKILIDKSNHAFASLVNYGKIVNDVSYKERYSQGTDSGAKCVPTTTGATTAEMLKGVLQGCPKTAQPPQGNDQRNNNSTIDKGNTSVANAAVNAAANPSPEVPQVSTWQRLKNWCASWFTGSQSIDVSRTAGAGK